MCSPAIPPAAPTQGVAPVAPEQRARLLALLEQCHARDQAVQCRRSYAVAPASPHPLDELATDPTRWQGFL
ncbi:MAG: hypothetical protein ACRYFV_15570 [Janthinobacterium lividum]